MFIRKQANFVAWFKIVPFTDNSKNLLVSRLGHDLRFRTGGFYDQHFGRNTGESYELAGPPASPSIPDTLQESLMARLDRLPQVRELASCLPKGSDRDQQEINLLEPIGADGGRHLLRRFPDSSAIVASATLVDLVG